MSTGLGLARRDGDSALLDAVAARHERIGLAGLGGMPFRRARWGAPPAPHAIAGFRWALRDDRHPRWWPQGIDVVPAADDHPDLIAVSWYSQRGKGARVTFVEPRPDAPRYRHVLLAAPEDGPRGALLAPVEVHAGGIAVVDDRLYVAATRGGLREFRLADLLRIRHREPGTDGALVLPQSAHLEATTASGNRQLRYSFVSLEEARGALGLVVGEYGTGVGGRLVRIPFDPERRAITASAEAAEVHDPGIPRMQGALVRDGTWYVTASRGHRAGGDLWVGDPSGFTRLEHELAPGPEDIAAWPRRGQLWTLAEFPGRRWVYALDAAETRRRASRRAEFAAAAAR